MWDTRLANRISCFRRSMELGSLASSGRTSFSATVRLSSPSWALYTLPMPPSPSRDSIRYLGPKKLPEENPWGPGDTWDWLPEEVEGKIRFKSRKSLRPFDTEDRS